MTNTTHAIRTITATGLAAIMTLGLTACMDGIEHPENYPTDGSKKITATSNPQDISADQLGHTWPLTVDHGTVSCTHNGKGDPVMRFTAPDGTRYALNQTSDNTRTCPTSISSSPTANPPAPSPASPSPSAT